MNDKLTPAQIKYYRRELDYKSGVKAARIAETLCKMAITERENKEEQ